jgi:hypothetical protein
MDRCRVAVCAGTTEYDGPRPSPRRHLPMAREKAKRRQSREHPSGRGELAWRGVRLAPPKHLDGVAHGDLSLLDHPHIDTAQSLVAVLGVGG